MDGCQLIDVEKLRQAILNELYAGAFTGTPAILVEVGDVEQADQRELIQIAERYGIPLPYLNCEE